MPVPERPVEAPPPELDRGRLPVSPDLVPAASPTAPVAASVEHTFMDAVIGLVRWTSFLVVALAVMIAFALAVFAWIAARADGPRGRHGAPHPRT
ncbi:MAG: hypothetical protein U0169_21895 [Polyangiaceae bacterium]